MTPIDRRMIGCNVIDPQLAVKGGTDYDLPITERSLEFLREIGHDATEFSHACHWSAEECEAVRGAVDRVGIYPWSLHAWAGWDPMADHGPAQLSSMLGTAVRNALILGTGVIVHHPHGKDMTDTPRLDREAELLSAAWQPGVRFALENMHTLASLEYAIALADKLGEDMAGICVDTGHAALGDLGPGRAVRMAGPRLITTHIQDNLGKHDDHMPPWDGTIEWGDVISALAEVRYDGCVLLELTDQPQDPARRPVIREELRRGHAAARRIADALPWPA